jgi:hypothetical protein
VPEARIVVERPDERRAFEEHRRHARRLEAAADVFGEGPDGASPR